MTKSTSKVKLQIKPLLQCLLRNNELLAVQNESLHPTDLRRKTYEDQITENTKQMKFLISALEKSEKKQAKKYNLRHSTKSKMEAKNVITKDTPRFQAEKLQKLQSVKKSTKQSRRRERKKIDKLTTAFEKAFADFGQE